MMGRVQVAGSAAVGRVLRLIDPFDGWYRIAWPDGDTTVEWQADLIEVPSEDERDQRIAVMAGLLG